MPEFKDLIKTRRLQIGKTLEQVGNEMGVSKATVQRWESGEIKDMRRGKLVALAKALETTPAYLMGWDSEKAPATKDDDGRTAEFVNLFSQLTETERALVIAQIKGVLAARE